MKKSRTVCLLTFLVLLATQVKTFSLLNFRRIPNFHCMNQCNDGSKITRKTKGNFSMVARKVDGNCCGVFRPTSENMDESIIALGETIKNFQHRTRLKKILGYVKDDLIKLRKKIEDATIRLQDKTDAAIDKSQAKIDDKVSTKTELVTSSCKNFHDHVASGADLCSCGQAYGNKALDIQANFTINVESKCLSTFEKKTNKAIKLSGDVIGRFAVNWNEIIDDVHSCFPFCAKKKDCGGCLNRYESKNPKWSQCIDDVRIFIWFCYYFC